MYDNKNFGRRMWDGIRLADMQHAASLGANIWVKYKLTTCEKKRCWLFWDRLEPVEGDESNWEIINENTPHLRPEVMQKRLQEILQQNGR